MSTALRSLQLAVKAAHAARDDAARALLAGARSVAQAQAQLVGLRDYAQDTAARFGPEQQAASLEVLRYRAQFLGRLHEAVGLQTQAVAQAEAGRARAHQTLVQADVRLASYQALLTRRRAELARQQARAEQKALDERAAHMHAFGNDGFGTGDLR
jgi:flagellar export protein FliJ